MMNKRYSYSQNPILYHTLFWIVYFVINTVRWGNYFDDYLYSIKSNLVEFPLHIILVYFNIYYLMPKLIPKRVGSYILLFAVSVLAITLIRIGITYELVTTEIFKESRTVETELFNLRYVVATFIGEVYVVGIVTAINMTINWVKFQNKESEMQKNQLETELAYLKTQIQPHFFFNTLNNLYSLTLDKSDKAPETVLKLSELMSYVIYEASENSVSLTNEINHINNYIDLEKLRYDDRLELSFDISGQISEIEVPPVIFLPFIENCFKHSSKTTGDNIPISLKIKVTDKWLEFICLNKVNEAVNGAKIQDKVAHKGIGLKNTERRLKLRYNQNYELKYGQVENEFSVYLKIPVK